MVVRYILVFLSVKRLWYNTGCASSLPIPKILISPLRPFTPYLSPSKQIMCINYLRDWLRTPVMTHELPPDNVCSFVKTLNMTVDYFCCDLLL